MGRSRSRRGWMFRSIATAAVLAGVGGCSTVSESWPAVATSLTRRGSRPSLLRVEQMIDELDRTMTQQGTIGVKSPDVWGQDRLAKFRSEYELQMAQWLKAGFKGVINASISRSEAQAQRMQIAADLVNPIPTGSSKASSSASTTTGQATDLDQTKALLSLISSQNPAAPAATPAASASKPATVTADPSAGGMLEPTVVLDEHSHYLNHLNQLRRINAGDDLTDRPGYGMYLVRIPVTLSPGPKNRRGRGAMITVSAKSLMDRDTMRYTLRNTVINEAVASVTQAICADEDDADPNPNSGLGPLSLITHADSQVLYGVENISHLSAEARRQLHHELADEPYHRTARVAEWLRGEFEASYAMLEQAAAPVPSHQGAVSAQSVRKGKGPAVEYEQFDPLETLGAMIARRDFPKLAALRNARPDPSVMLANGAAVVPEEAALNRRRTLDALAFVLRIQAAALNARLKQDIVDQMQDFSREALRQVNFFHPDSSNEALEIFQRYADAKWPLRVYAIEPVIAQQNVADSLARRSSSGLDLIGGVPAFGPFRAAGVFSNEAARAEDEAAIRLNPTMVGFGAGENTFGWIFYPRLQTRRAGRGLLAGLLESDPGDKDQSLEPGQRECTALIVMPNFVPKIEFVTVANWFKTSDLNDGRTATIERASDLAARLVEANNALTEAASTLVDEREGYLATRPEELQIAVERLNQLRSLMPTQRLVVRVPFSAEHNDSRVFCSRGGQLRPSLTAWHGKPPEHGEEATIFLEGKNFSVHDTHVIAGGKPAESVLVSRNLMQITIAKDARPTPNATGDPLLEISVATPNGASNHLLIRMRPPSSPPPDAEPARTPPPPAPHTAAADPAPAKPDAPIPTAGADPEVRRTSESHPAAPEAKLIPLTPPASASPPPAASTPAGGPPPASPPPASPPPA